MSAMPIRPSLLRRSLSPVIATAALLAFGLTGAQAKPVKSVKATKPSVQRVSAEAADPAAARTGLPATVTTALRRAHVPLSAASFYVIKVGAPPA
jgi:D-alanyl-D-alanine carboxypeptidase/D-alanyl-D-alanine-endopeptidase (penicillin-binding protein 4)